LVQYVEGPKRGADGSRNPSLSCANTIEARRVISMAGYIPELLPRG
jgi:hypothetical protein